MQSEDWATTYHDHGFCVVPVPYGKKHPFIDWKQYQTERPSRDQVVEWFKGLELNFALICGKVSDNFIVLDFDDPTFYSKFFDPQKIEAITPVVKTGRGGIHVYLRNDESIQVQHYSEIKLDVIGDGGLVIAPPSLHPNGNYYEFLNGFRDPLRITGIEKTIEEKLRSLGIESKKKSIKQIVSGVQSGERNTDAFRYARFMLGFIGLDKTCVWNELQRWNYGNNPPLSEDELRTVFDSACNYGGQDPEDRGDFKKFLGRL